MKLNRSKKMINPVAILGIIFVVVIAIEAYLLYYRVYGSLLAQPDEVADEKIVRLDINSYNKTVQLLDAYRQYVPAGQFPKNINPFK